MKSRWPILFVAVAATFLAMLDNYILVVALPTIRSDLGLSIEQVQWVVEGYVLSFASLVVLGGSLADRLGPRQVFISGVCIFTLGSLVSGMAEGSALLLSGRIVAGAGTALMIPAGLAIVARSFEGVERGTALGIWAASSGVAVCLGPVAGGLIVETLTWHWIFLVNVPLGIGLVAAARWRVPSWRPARNGLPSLGSSVLLVVAAFAIFFAVIQGSALQPVVVAGLVALGVLAGGLFCGRELSTTDPIVDLRLLRLPTMPMIVVVAALLYFGFIPLNIYLSIYLQLSRGLTAVETAITMLPVALLVVVIAPFAGRLAARIGSARVMTAGLAAGALGAFLLCLSVGGSLSLLLLGEILLGVAVGLTISPISVGVLKVVPLERHAVAMGMTTAIREFGGALGLALLSIVFVRLVTAESAEIGSSVQAGTTIPSDPGAVSALDAGATGLFASAGLALVAALVVVVASRVRSSVRARSSTAIHAGG